MKVPPRWLKCPRKGQLIADKFLPFKTPLDERYNEDVPEQYRFDVPMILSFTNAMRKKIGMWIDLTNTTRFYNSKVVDQQGVHYVKLQCRGHGETPSVEQTQAFIRMCGSFIAKNPLNIIGVHCTHGFNRTGFLICAYLVEALNWSIEAAVSAFAQARPPGIYKADYLKELFSRYGDEEETPDAPALPSWCFEEEENVDDDGNAIDDNGPPTKRRCTETMKKNAVFCDEMSIPGVTQVTQQPRLSEIQARVQKICKWTRKGFPGSQPVSMDQENVKRLSSVPYRVSWKADGTRYMMLIAGRGEVYLLDRDNTVFNASALSFWYRKNPGKHLEDTLVDGELVVDRVDGQPIPRYLIYDAVQYEGLNVGGTDFPTRQVCIEKELIGPRHEMIKQGRLDKTREPFSVRIKQFYDLTAARKLLDGAFATGLSHEVDGLIFQPFKDPYKPGQCPETLKWKPPELNSVDFKLVVQKISGEGMVPEMKGLLFVGGQHGPFGEIKLTKELRQYNQKIIECSWDFQKRCWKFMRVRNDKSFPNAFKTAQSVCESIRHPVTKKMLFDIIYSAPGVSMPPPAQPRS